MHQCIVHCVLGHFLAKSRKLRNGVNTFNRLVIVLAQSGQIRLGAAEVMLMDAEIRNCCLDMECCCSRDRGACAVSLYRYIKYLCHIADLLGLGETATVTDIRL